MEFLVDEDRLREALSGIDKGPGGPGIDMSDFSNKFSVQIKNLEQRFVKLQKMFDLNRLMSKIDLKADDEAVRTEFNNHDFKITDVDRSCDQNSKDIDALHKMIKQLYAAM